MFRDRYEAGQKLAQKLKPYQAEHPILLALPRGGVPIGLEIAKVLKVPLDILVVRKIGAPGNPEFGVGAIAPDVQIFNDPTLRLLGIEPSDLQGIIDQEKQELNRRNQLYRQGKDLPDMAGKVVILVDDGLATGITIRAAIQAVKKFTPAKIILAVPVGSSQAVKKLREVVDEVVCLEIPPHFYAVGAFYESFPQVSDEEVIELLKKAREQPS